LQAVPDTLPGLREWLAEWASKRTAGPATAFLDSVVQKRLAAARPPPSAARGGAASLDQLCGLLQGWLDGTAAPATKARLDALLGPQHATAPAPASASAPSLAQDEMAQLSDEVNRLEAALRASARWRFALESSARRVAASLDDYLHVRRRAPTQAELESLADVLNEAVDLGVS
jgi:hypothetical protein